MVGLGVQIRIANSLSLRILDLKLVEKRKFSQNPAKTPSKEGLFCVRLFHLSGYDLLFWPNDEFQTSREFLYRELKILCQFLRRKHQKFHVVGLS